jgi:HSP20 family protein
MLFSDFGRFGGFDPFREMRRMQNEMNRLFADFGAATTQEFPPLNLWVGENSVVVTAEIPGVAGDDLDITVHEDVLTLKGKREAKTEGGENVVWHRREIPSGSFTRTVQLPFRVDSDRVQARCNNGVLEIELHRPEADRPRKIQIQAR